jgi:hypothetical protein
MTDGIIKVMVLITMFAFMIWATLSSVSCAIGAGVELVEKVST